MVYDGLVPMICVSVNVRLQNDSSCAAAEQSHARRYCAGESAALIMRRMTGSCVAEARHLQQERLVKQLGAWSLQGSPEPTAEGEAILMPASGRRAFLASACRLSISCSGYWRKPAMMYSAVGLRIAKDSVLIVMLHRRVYEGWSFAGWPLRRACRKTAGGCWTSACSISKRMHIGAGSWRLQYSS